VEKKLFWTPPVSNLIVIRNVWFRLNYFLLISVSIPDLSRPPPLLLPKPTCSSWSSKPPVLHSQDKNYDEPHCKLPRLNRDEHFWKPNEEFLMSFWKFSSFGILLTCQYKIPRVPFIYSHVFLTLENETKIILEMDPSKRNLKLCNLKGQHSLAGLLTYPLQLHAFQQAHRNSEITIRHCWPLLEVSGS